MSVFITLIHTLFPLCTLFRVTYANCVVSSTTSLPDACYLIQSAYIPSSNTVYIFRGSNSNLIYKWDISNSNSFVTVGTAPVTADKFHSWANSVSVIDNLVYFIGNDQEAYPSSVPVYIFNTNTDTWIDNSNIQKPPNGGVDGCVTHNKTHLFFIGGDYGPLPNKLQIYDIANNQWFSSQITLSSITGDHYWGQFCWMNDNVLYVFGGVIGMDKIGDIFKWEHTEGWSSIGSLGKGRKLAHGKATKHPLYNSIWLVGGRDNGFYYDEIYEFDIASETAVKSNYTLNYRNDNIAVEFIDNDLYVFGGRTASGFGSTDVDVCQDIVNIAEETTTTTTAFITTPKPTITNTSKPTFSDINTSTALTDVTMYTIPSTMINTVVTTKKLITSASTFITVLCIMCFILMVVIYVFCRRRKSVQEQNAVMKNVVNSVDKYDAVLVQWFFDTVELPQYLDAFINEGYNDLAMIKRIENKEELLKIGIVDVTDQEMMMDGIIALRQESKREVPGEPYKAATERHVDLQSVMNMDLEQNIVEMDIDVAVNVSSEGNEVKMIIDSASDHEAVEEEDNVFTIEGMAGEDGKESSSEHKIPLVNFVTTKRDDIEANDDRITYWDTSGNAVDPNV